MTESQLKNKVKKMIREEFPEVYSYKASDRWQSGIPDLLICAWGTFVGIELKTAEGKVAPLQAYVIKCINAAGGIAGVARNVEDARQMILEARERAEKIR
ncbi:MAG: VRR-NUC domain-containing protein [Candidatus Omnitrophota bacterium]